MKPSRAVISSNKKSKSSFIDKSVNQKKIINSKNKPNFIDKNPVNLKKLQNLSVKLKLNKKIEKVSSAKVILKFIESLKKANPLGENKDLNIIVNKLFNKYPEGTATKFLSSFNNIAIENARRSPGNKYENILFTRFLSNLLVEKEKLKDVNGFSKFHFSLEARLGENHPDVKIFNTLVNNLNPSLYSQINELKADLKKRKKL